MPTEGLLIARSNRTLQRRLRYARQVADAVSLLMVEVTATFSADVDYLFPNFSFVKLVFVKHPE